MPTSRQPARSAPAELERLLANYTPNVRDLAMRARELILEIQPDAIEKVWPGWKVVGYGTGPTMKEMVLGVAPLKERLRIGFTNGVALPDPEGLLGGEGKGHRALKVATREALESPAVQRLLRAAFSGVRISPDETMRDERARGVYAKHQAASGYQVSASKTVAAPLTRLWAAWIDAHTRRRWLPDATFTVRKATDEKSMRITWEDGSRVDVLFYAKGAGRSQVSVDHRKLGDAGAVERLRGFWRERLVRLQALLEA